MLRIPVATSSAAYEAVIEPGLLGRAGMLLRERLRGTAPVFVVTVPPVRRRWAKVLLSSLAAASFAPKVLEMPDGERSKRLATVEKLAESLVRLGADRKAVIVAFGGGVIGDVAGLLASLYMRGVKLVEVPTTVQAQLDASIGGKTGVNLRSGKNLIGTFFQPQLVVIDPEVLSTLGEREFRAGLYEAIKCGVIGHRELFCRLEVCSLAQLQAERELLTWTIAESVKLKAQVVSADERESGLRRILNFGHTLGHALEAATRYRHFLHGEAVAWGMIAAARIAREMGLTNTETCERIRRATLVWGTLPRIRVPAASVLELVRSDKKTESGVVHFILPTEIGKVEIRNDVPRRLIASSLAEIVRFSRG
jgi:3-dehydroquinate synthase